VDVAVSWHPADRNSASPTSSTANITGTFRFHGISAHAAAAPDRGRSALDAVEAMDYMVNMMREHVPQETRIHYIITRGGAAPNVVPDFAEAYYCHAESVSGNANAAEKRRDRSGPCDAVRVESSADHGRPAGIDRRGVRPDGWPGPAVAP
jgi:aminobenzoyl-glutamate utilization protein B